MLAKINFLSDSKSGMPHIGEIIDFATDHLIEIGQIDADCFEFSLQTETTNSAIEPTFHFDFNGYLLDVVVNLT